MSLPSDDDDMLRRAEIEEMMRSDRARYFRDEPLQQEYRDIVSRMDERPDALKLLQPGRFDVALANYLNQKGRADFDPSKREADAPYASLSPDAHQPPDQLHDLGESEKKRSDKPNLVRVAQNGPLAGANILPGVASSFVTDGINRVEQRQNNAKIRKGQLSFELEDQLNYAAYKTGLGVEVKSGGQPVYGIKGVDWIGDRHNDGGAGDVKLFEVVNGKRRYLNSSNDADRQKLQDFMRFSVIAGATGIGHGYMGLETTHIGGGSVQAWQDMKKGSPPAFPWVQSALDDGHAERQRLMKSGWNGLVDTMAKGRPLSLSPPKLAPTSPLTEKQREEKFLPRKNLLPPLY